jgi:hypothetical protein
LKEVLRVQTNAEVYVKISAITHVVSEIGTYIINNAGQNSCIIKGRLIHMYIVIQTEIYVQDVFS